MDPRGPRLQMPQSNTRILQQLWVYSAVKTNEKQQQKKSKGEFNLSPWLIPTPLNGDLVICESILLSFWG